MRMSGGWRPEGTRAVAPQELGEAPGTLWPLPEASRGGTIKNASVPPAAHCPALCEHPFAGSLITAWAETAHSYFTPRVSAQPGN